MTTTVWLCEPRSHGRNKGASHFPGRPPSVAVPHRSASSAVCPCGHAASFLKRREFSKRLCRAPLRPHRAGSRRSTEGSRACLDRFGDCEPSLGAMGVLRRCCSGGGASLCRKIMPSRPQVPRAALQPRSMSPSAKKKSADARALADGPRRGVTPTQNSGNDGRP